VGGCGQQRIVGAADDALLALLRALLESPSWRSAGSRDST
jgi:hypothetical protein